MVETRVLGRTGLPVSALGLGAAYIKLPVPGGAARRGRGAAGQGDDLGLPSSPAAR